MAKWLKKKKLKAFFNELFKLHPEIDAISITDKDKTIISILNNENYDLNSNPPFISEKLINNIKISIWAKKNDNLKKYLKSSIFLLKELLRSEYEKRAVTEEALSRYRELAFLSHIAYELNKSLDLKYVASTLINECSQIAKESKYGALFIIEDNKFKLLSCFGKDAEAISEKVSETKLFKEIIYSKKVEIINQVANDKRWNAFIPQIISLLCASLYYSDKIIGGIFLAGTAPFSSLHLKSISTIIGFGATAIANAIHFNELQRLLEATMVSLATAIDSRDPCTAGHSRRTAQYAWALGNAINKDTKYFPDLKFSENELKELYYAALLHDVGKIGVRENVLSKATKLPEERIDIIFLKLNLFKIYKALPDEFQNISEIIERISKINKSGYLLPEDKTFIENLSKLEIMIDNKKIKLLDENEKEALLIQRGNLLPKEWEEIKNHPVESDRILQQIIFPESMKNLKRIVREHHEKLDGSGYPDGKKNSELLLQSRILAVCDIYDALTAADRPYKKAFPIDKAIAILKEEAESGKLDKKVVNVFIEKVLGYRDNSF